MFVFWFFRSLPPPDGVTAPQLSQAKDAMVYDRQRSSLDSSRTPSSFRVHIGESSDEDEGSQLMVSSGSELTSRQPWEGHGSISLVDRTQQPDDFAGHTWARDVRVTDHTIVRGGDKIAAYVVWIIWVAVESVSEEHPTGIQIRKRYSEFARLRSDLLSAFPTLSGALPKLPPKSVVSKFRPSFLEKRRRGLEYFLSCVLLNPQFGTTPIVRSWFFS